MACVPVPRWTQEETEKYFRLQPLWRIYLPDPLHSSVRNPLASSSRNAKQLYVASCTHDFLMVTHWLPKPAQNYASNTDPKPLSFFLSLLLLLLLLQLKNHSIYACLSFGQLDQFERNGDPSASPSRKSRQIPETVLTQNEFLKSVCQRSGHPHSYRHRRRLRQLSGESVEAEFGIDARRGGRGENREDIRREIAAQRDSGRFGLFEQGAEISWENQGRY